MALGLPGIPQWHNTYGGVSTSHALVLLLRAGPWSTWNFLGRRFCVGGGIYFLLNVSYLFFLLWLNICDIKLAIVTTFNYTVTLSNIHIVVQPSPPSISSTSSSSLNESPYP